jgi:hypothetical protein
MQRLLLILILALVSTGAWCDFSCPVGTEAACLDGGDKVCPESTQCVDEHASCFDEYPCELSEGFVCASQYDKVMKEFENTAQQYDQLISENVNLREMRLEQRNCVLNASTLDGAKRCVR